MKTEEQCIEELARLAVKLAEELHPNDDNAFSLFVRPASLLTMASQRAGDYLTVPAGFPMTDDEGNPI